MFRNVEGSVVDPDRFKALRAPVLLEIACEAGPAAAKQIMGRVVGRKPADVPLAKSLLTEFDTSGGCAVIKALPDGRVKILREVVARSQ